LPGPRPYGILPEGVGLLIVIAVAAELMASTRLQGLLGAAGCELTLVEPEVAAVDAALQGTAPAVVILDLGVPEAVRRSVFEAARRTGAPVIAFGPHEDVAGLRAARAAGAAEVIARGALGHALLPLLAKHQVRLAAGGLPPAPQA